MLRYILGGINRKREPERIVRPDNYYQDLLRKAYHVAESSLDPRTHNGAVLISEDGHLIAAEPNTLPDGVRAFDRLSGPNKYKYIEHAERNVIYMAARKGLRTENAMLVCPWAACPECARAIIQARIRLVVVHEQRMLMTPLDWKADVDLGLELLKEGRVKIEAYNGKIGSVTNLARGETWEP